MIKDHRKNVENYFSSLIQIKRMLALNIINSDDVILFEGILAKKYCIKRCSIYRENDLIETSLSGNIVHNKEVV